MKGRTPREMLASNFYGETVIQYKYFDFRQRVEFQNVCAPINKRTINDGLIKEWDFLKIKCVDHHWEVT